jgi:hypothetical protein
MNGKEQYKRHKTYLKSYMRKWSRKNKDKVVGYKENLKLEVFIHYSSNPPKCACCGETEIRFLTIDHIKGNGQEERLKIYGSRTFSGSAFYSWLRKNNFPDLSLQVMCSNCNMAKGKSKTQFCPVHHPEQY